MAEKSGGLNRSMQHWLAVYSPDFQSPRSYFSRNFYLTTSGHFHTKGLLDAISEIGVDRLLFSADYLYESMASASHWFDNALLSTNDREKIGRTNAQTLFRL
jgi:predicted TIM-barrel fold metal-dependent hydrolase